MLTIIVKFIIFLVGIIIYSFWGTIWTVLCSQGKIQGSTKYPWYARLSNSLRQSRGSFEVTKGIWIRLSETLLYVFIATRCCLRFFRSANSSINNKDTRRMTTCLWNRKESLYCIDSIGQIIKSMCTNREVLVCNPYEIVEPSPDLCW